MTTHFNHSIHPDRLPILLDALFWYHCQMYFPSHDPHKNTLFDHYTMTSSEQTQTCILMVTSQEDRPPQPLSPPFDYRTQPKTEDSSDE